MQIQCQCFIPLNLNTKFIINQPSWILPPFRREQYSKHVEGSQFVSSLWLNMAISYHKFTMHIQVAECWCYLRNGAFLSTHMDFFVLIGWLSFFMTILIIILSFLHLHNLHFLSSQKESSFMFFFLSYPFFPPSIYLFSLLPEGLAN